MVRIQVKSGFDPNWVEMETQSTTLTDLLFELSNKLPNVWYFDREQQEFYSNCAVFLNGQAYTDLVDGLNTRLKNNDKVEVCVIPIQGG